jgi:cephalosporin hydroxylase
MDCDSEEYDILTNAVTSTNNIPGFTLEIGVRKGGSSKLIIENSLSTKIHIAVDPFGNIDYTHFESQVVKLDYTNKMKNTMLAEMYKFCSETNRECLFFPLEDTEFFNRFADGVPVYSESKSLINEYSLVFLDGPHSVSAVLTEFDFFKTRMRRGAMIVFDDIDQYPHMESVDEYVRENNFIIAEKGNRKISYMKV